MKPKLLVVTSTFPRWPGDIDPPFVSELSKRLTESFEVIVLTPHYPGSLRREISDNMKIIRFRYFWSRFERLAGGQGIMPKLRQNKLYYLLIPFFLAAQFSALIKLMISVKPDIVHAHWLIPQGFLSVVAKKIFNIPIIVTAHGADVFSLRQWLFKKAKQYTTQGADSIVTVSRSAADILTKDIKFHRRPEIISMGVNTRLFAPQKADISIRKQFGICGPFILYVGRLTEKKGITYLIDAMNLVLQQRPDAKLLVVGHGESERQLISQVKKMKLEDAILFVGGLPNDDLPPFYATADVFVGPSIQTKDGDTEGLGLTFIEASMSGCLVIGTRTGGIEDIIEDGKTGFVVSPRNTEELGKKIVFVINNLEFLQEMRTKSRKKAIEKFRWETIVGRYERLFFAALERHSQERTNKYRKMVD